MSNVIPIFKTQPPQAKCSFCGKPEKPGERIVIAKPDTPNVCICSDCVRTATQRIKETP